jgi:hypothetical protein
MYATIQVNVEVCGLETVTVTSPASPLSFYYSIGSGIQTVLKAVFDSYFTSSSVNCPIVEWNLLDSSNNLVSAPVSIDIATGDINTDTTSSSQ